ncbi:MAG: carboxypeptidase M32 [Rhodospirillaceae bacterium]
MPSDSTLKTPPPSSQTPASAGERAYRSLTDRFERIGRLGEAQEVLSWDRAAMMPAGGAAGRAEQMAVLSTVLHEMITDPALSDALDAAEADPPSDPWDQANLRAMRRDWIHAAALPVDLVEAISRASSRCEEIWRGAKEASDFAAVQEPLEVLLGLVQQVATAKAERLGTSPYDALLDEYEPGGSSAAIDVIFEDLAGFLPGFLEEVLEHQARTQPAAVPEGPFPTAQQKALGQEVMKTMGFDFTHGRLDVSAHPFCGGAPRDVRLTTRYDESDFASALMGVIHETGHALYELGLPEVHLPQPAARSGGMSLHESQSLLMEMQASRSRPFLSWLAPRAKAAFNGTGPAWEPDALHKTYIRVERGFIRVDADEVTYPAHVILRYRLEQAMIAGDLKIADLPGAWNEQMQALLGVTPPNDRLGCLQDIHWYDGAFGYFPTYTLGAMTAAQLFQAACKAHPEILEDLARGDFSRLLGWLRHNVHGKGSTLSASALLTEATGGPLDPQIFKDHLRRRYLEGT